MHLKRLLGHLTMYFTRDKLDSTIPVRLLVIEQVGTMPFNAGALRNAGFLLAERSSDYTCFHDVDYLPIWADYSIPDQPSCIVWYGAEARPIDPKVLTMCIIVWSSSSVGW